MVQTMALATRMYVCESADHPSSLLLGLNEQRLKGTLCDITVRVQGHLFKAHVNVLASAMGYFRDLFCKANKDKHEGVIDIPMIVNSTGFAKVLDFVYTSQLCLSQSTVMQVLCSACYLQIPYVVEKCQEFITTHGHVTSPSSLSAVTGPLLHGLQRNSNYSSAGPAQSASASLTLLSQLNRANDLSRSRSTATNGNVPKQQKQSPNRQDADDQQVCELINTPPSPDNRSNGDENASGSPEAAEATTPKDNEADNKLVEVKSEHFIGNHGDDFMPETNGHRDFSQVDTEREQIDHNSLALYFREKDHWTETERPLVPYYTSQDGTFTDNLPAITHSMNRLSESSVFSSSHISMLAKKEKPKKEYRCEYCNKMFGRQQHLKRHILTHTGERPYPCQYCEKRFRRSEHLKHHLVSHEQQQSNVSGFVMPPPKKKQRRAEDAVALSKMMLTSSYNQLTDRTQGPTGPVILPSMYAGVERKSPVLQAIPLKQDFSAADNNSNSPPAHREVASNGTDDPPAFLTALNLSRATPKGDNADPEAASSPSADHVPNGELEERASEELNTEENVNHSPKSDVESNPVPGFESLNEPSSIIGMEGSEMLSSDLKRLIAAMDE